MDKTRIFEAAGKFAAKGQLEKAAKEYQRVLEEDPKDVRALQKLAELYQKSGKGKEAAELMLRVAEGYGEQGFFLKAVAVYKQVLKLVTDRVDVNLKLAQIYQQLGLISDATQQYQTVAAYYDRAGNVRESLGVLRRLVDLDPDNVESRRHLAELYGRERMTAEAVSEFRRAAAYLKKHNRTDDYLRVLERIGQLVPDDFGVAKELAQLYLGSGEAKRALAKLQVCFRQNPRDVETLQLLARAFIELGQSAKTVSVYRELAHVHADTGDVEAQRRVLQAILQLVPDDPEATDALAQLGRAAAPAALVPPPPEPPPSPTIRTAGPPPSKSADAGSFSRTSIAGLPASVLKVLTETDVYLKYNLVAKAAEHIQKALAEAADSLAVQEKLLAILDRQGRGDEAVQVLAQLVELARRRGELEAESAYIQDLAQRAPGHPLVTEALRAAELGPVTTDDLIVEADETELAAAALATEAAGEDEFAEAIEIDTEPTRPPEALGIPAIPVDVGALAADELPALVVDEDDAPLDPPLDPSFALDEVDEDDVVVLEDEVVAVVDELSESDFDVSPAAPPPFAADPFAADEATVVDERPMDEREAAVTPRSFAEEVPAEAEQAEEQAADLYAEELAEAEFLSAQGLEDDARIAAEAILAHAPNHPGALALVSRLAPAAPPPFPGTSLRAGAIAVPAPEPLAGDEGFNLARELADEFDILETPKPVAGPGVSVAGVLDDLARHAADGAAGEDSQTHYDLGIAYKEMGLYDEAIHEFEVAMQARGRRRVIDCLTMIGVCRMERGELREAVASFQQALKTPGLTLEASKESHYEIGRCLEQLGDETKALDHYARVYRADPAFRDVKARAGRLAAKMRAAGQAPAGARTSGGTGAGGGASGATQAPATRAPAGGAAPASGGRGGKIGYI